MQNSSYEREYQIAGDTAEGLKAIKLNVKAIDKGRQSSLFFMLVMKLLFNYFQVFCLIAYIRHVIITILRRK
jgi:hypothetical protein